MNSCILLIKLLIIQINLIWHDKCFSSVDRIFEYRVSGFGMLQETIQSDECRQSIQISQPIAIATNSEVEYVKKMCAKRAA